MKRSPSALKQLGAVFDGTEKRSRRDAIIAMGFYIAF